MPDDPQRVNVVARVGRIAPQLFRRGVQERAGTTEGGGHEFARGRLLARGLDRPRVGDPADAEIRDLARDLAIQPLDQDVRRLQVAMHDRRVDPVGERDDPGQVEDDLRDHLRGRLPALGMPVLDQTAQVAPLDVFVAEAGGIGALVGLLKRDDPRMAALPLDPGDRPSIRACRNRSAATGSVKNLKAASPP